jgi:hypothetical protein
LRLSVTAHQIFSASQASETASTTSARPPEDEAALCFDLKTSSRRGKELQEIISEMESAKDDADDEDLLALMDKACV